MEQWKEYKISDIIEEIAMGPFGSNIKVDNFIDFGIPVLNGSNLQGFKLNEDSFNYVSEEKAESLGRANAFRGDVVITHRGTLGQIVYIPLDSKYERYVISQSQFRLKLNQDLIRPDFLVYFFHTRIGQHRILMNASQVGVPALARPTSTFKEVSIPVPPMEIQNKIMSILLSLNNKIEINRRINDNLEQQAQALFKSWFVDFEPFKDGKFVESEMGMIPEGWKYIKLGKLCESVSITHPQKTGKLIFLNTGDIECGMVNKHNYMNINEMPGQAKKSIKENDILYSEIRPCNKHYAFVNFSADQYIVSTKLMVIRTYNNNSLRIYQFVTRKEIIDLLQHEAESRSGTFPQIRFDNISDLDILLATEPIEKQYSHLISGIYNKIFKNELEISKLQQLRDCILPKLMSGELKINDLNC